MLVRTFALWVGLGISVASAAALTVPATAAHGGGPPAAALVPLADDTTAPGAHFVDGKALLLDGRLGHASVARDPQSGAASTFILATVTAAEHTSGVHDG